jgi:hypothetical protein
MRYLDWLAKGSEAHNAERTGAVLTISAVDSSLPSLKAFLPVALDAIDRDGMGYTIVLKHQISAYPGDLYDKIVIQCEEPS